MAGKKGNKPGEGAVFENDRKREGKKDPDFTGTFTDERGIEYWVSAWKHITDKGVKYFSMSMKRKEEQGASQEAPGNKSDPWG